MKYKCPPVARCRVHFGSRCLESMHSVRCVTASSSDVLLRSVLLFGLWIGIAVPTTWAQSKVTLTKVDGQFVLHRDGEPYHIKGVGGQSHLSLLAGSGGNSVRTWDDKSLDELLPLAHQHGLTVCVGIWLGHERHGFDYQDETAVWNQLQHALKVVRKHKDHPAVLMWAIGNEMEGKGTNPAIWYAIDHIARKIKQIDPNHPTMTVVAEIGPNKTRAIERYCPNVDIIGVNSYGGITSLVDRYRKAGAKKPYIVTEFGPLGPWEVEKTRWNAPIEASSTQKASMYRNGYRVAVAQPVGLCLGSYAFLWGHKQETTATWFGMLLPDGSRTAAVDALSESWTHTPPKNRCPEIESLVADVADGLKPSQQIELTLKAKDPENDALKVHWVLRHDLAIIGTGGDAQNAQESIDQSIVETSAVDGLWKARLTVPEGGGGYRAFVRVSDDHGGAAVANVPLYVDAPVKIIPAKRATLPLVVYDEPSAAEQLPYIAAGYMGNTQAVVLNENCGKTPHSGASCLEVRYDAPDAWGGVLWQSPPGDWEGKLPGGFDLRGAEALEFWVRGEQGGEVVNFVFGSIDGQTPYRDSAKGELTEVRLTDQWQRMVIPLKNKDLSRIKTGFGWSAAGQGKPITFYLDRIVYRSEL